MCLQKHCSEDVFRDALNMLMTKRCPAVSWATADTPGVCIQNFQDCVEQLFNSQFWNEKMDFSGPKRRPLIRISSDGTQAGEMFVYNLEITGLTILNLKTQFLQSVNFYVPLAVIPMQESKSNMERFLFGLYNDIDTTESIRIPDPTCALGYRSEEPIVLDSDDYAGVCYKLKHLGSNSKYFCTECTQTHDNFKVRGETTCSGCTRTPVIDEYDSEGTLFVTSKEMTLPQSIRIDLREAQSEHDGIHLAGLRRGAERSKAERRVSILQKRIEYLDGFLGREQDSTSMVTRYYSERRQGTEYPVLERAFLKDKSECKHHWWSHKCACYVILGDVFEEHRNQPIDEMHAQCQLDGALIAEELRLEEEANNRIGVAKALQAAIRVKELELKELVREFCGGYSACETKHRRYEKSKHFGTRFLWSTIGKPLRRNGNAVQLTDIGHLWANTFKDSMWTLLKEVLCHASVLKEMQMHFFEIELKHIELDEERELHSEAWADWITTQPNRKTIMKPMEPRSELSWKEMTTVMDHFPSCVDCLDSAPLEHSAVARKAKRVLMKLHYHWLNVTVEVKKMHHDASDGTPVSTYHTDDM